MQPVCGALAKRLCSGLQIHLGRFDSATRLHFPTCSVRQGPTIRLPILTICLVPDGIDVIASISRHGENPIGKISLVAYITTICNQETNHEF